MKSVNYPIYSSLDYRLAGVKPLHKLLGEGVIREVKTQKFNTFLSTHVTVVHFFGHVLREEIRKFLRDFEIGVLK